MVSFWGTEVVVVVVTSLRGGGGEEEENTKQPDRAEEKKSTAISFCSMGGLTSTFELAILSSVREAIFSLSKSREECGATCARCSSSAVNYNRGMVGSFRGQAFETEEKGKLGESALMTFFTANCKNEGRSLLTIQGRPCERRVQASAYDVSQRLRTPCGKNDASVSVFSLLLTLRGALYGREGT